MFKINQYFKSLEPYLKLENLYQVFIGITIAIILILSGLSLLQRMAYLLLHEPEIKKAQYFNLIRAYQLEIAEMKEYPAIEPEK